MVERLETVLPFIFMKSCLSQDAGSEMLAGSKDEMVGGAERGAMEVKDLRSCSREKPVRTGRLDFVGGGDIARQSWSSLATGEAGLTGSGTTDRPGGRAGTLLLASENLGRLRLGVGIELGVFVPWRSVS